MTISQITGSYSSGINLSNGNDANPVTATGSAYGSSSGLSAFAAWTIVNQGGVGAGAMASIWTPAGLPHKHSDRRGHQQ